MDDLTTKTKLELAAMIATYPLEEKGILARDELQRRLVKEQHELDIELVTKQLRSTRFFAILGIIGTLLGAILGATIAPWLQHMWSQHPSRCTQPTVQQETAPMSEKLDNHRRKTPLQEQMNGKDVSYDKPR